MLVWCRGLGDLFKRQVFFFFQAEDGIRDLVRSRGLGDVYKRQHYRFKTLGFDLKKLEELDRQAQEEARQLQELASLRDAKSPEREQDYEGFEHEIQAVSYTHLTLPTSDLV